MLKRDYPTQYCSVASTLEIIGERWTILIVRDIFLGIRRFDDLQRTWGWPATSSRPAWSAWSSTGSGQAPYQERPSARVPADREGADLWPVLVSCSSGATATPSTASGPMILQHKGCGGELDDRRRCVACGADVSVTEAVAVRTGPNRTRWRRPRSGLSTAPPPLP
jgi:hypothetical protein